MQCPRLNFCFRWAFWAFLASGFATVLLALLTGPTLSIENGPSVTRPDDFEKTGRFDAFNCFAVLAGITDGTFGVARKGSGFSPAAVHSARTL